MGTEQNTDKDVARVPFRLRMHGRSGFSARNRLHLIARANGVDLTLTDAVVPGAVAGVVTGTHKDATRFLATVDALARRARLQYRRLPG